MEYGRHIIAHWREKFQNAKASRLEASFTTQRVQFIDDIQRLFFGLEILAMDFTGSRPNAIYDSMELWQLPPRRDFPESFTSVDHANQLGWALTMRAGQLRVAHLHQSTIKDPVSPALEARRADLLDQFAHFAKASARLTDELARTQDWSNVHPMTRPKALMLHVMGHWIRLTSGWGRPETECDRLTPQFEFVISLASDIVGYERKTNRGSPSYSTFSFQGCHTWNCTNKHAQMLQPWGLN